MEREESYMPRVFSPKSDARSELVKQFEEINIEDDQEALNSQIARGGVTPDMLASLKIDEAEPVNISQPQQDPDE